MPKRIRTVPFLPECGNDALSPESPDEPAAIAVRTPQRKRYERMKKLEIQFPEPAPSELPAEAFAPANVVKSSGQDAEPYPNLRIRLRDMELAFQADYRPVEVAKILRKTDRTVRAWISKELVAFHTWPSGERYFTPQDLEELLAGTAGSRKEAN